MDRNSIIGIIIIFFIMIGWSYFSQPTPEEQAALKRSRDSITAIEKHQDSLVKLEQKVANVQAQQGEIKAADATAVVDTTALTSKYGVFASAAKATDSVYTLENDLLKIQVSAKGGRIISVNLKTFKTFEKKPLLLFDEANSKFDLNFFAENRNINTGELYFTSTDGKKDIKVSGKDSASLRLRLYTDHVGNKKYIEYVYTIKGSSYVVDYKINTVGMQDVFSAGTDALNLDWQCRPNRQEKSLDNERNVTTVYFKPSSDDVDYLSETKSDDVSIKTSLKWISFKEQFFAATLIAENTLQAADMQTITEEKSDKHIKTMIAKISLPLGAGNSGIPLQFYFGPLKYKELKKYNLDLEHQIALGWGFAPLAWINRFAVIPVFNFLEGFNINYGIIILILTILLKIVLFPIAYKTYLSSARMKVLKPETDEINKKFPKSEDALKKQQALMSLYKKAGVNPMAGCVPMLLQIPILIALFRFFPASIELRQQAFLWANDLSSYDSIYNMPFNIPFYGSHISLWTLLMTISTIIYTKINADSMPQNNQMPGMKTIMYIMPIMFLGIFNNYACGLSYYYFLANVITFIQIYAFKFMIDEDKLHKQIQANKAKPVKKSGFQARLEEMAKKRGYNPR